MNKSELVAEIKKHCGKDCSRSCAQTALEAMLKAVHVGLKKDGAVQLIGFGTFKVVKRKARTGINPKTKKAIKIPAKNAVTFKVGAKLKQGI